MIQKYLLYKSAVSSPTSPVANNQRKYKAIQSRSKDFIEIQKEERIEHAYNKISDVENKCQIISSLKLMQGASERVVLIDRILKRKQEIKQMKEKMTLYKLLPVFQILINKVRKKREKNLGARKNERLLTREVAQLEERVKCLQSKFTTQFALSWLTDKRAKEGGMKSSLEGRMVEGDNKKTKSLTVSEMSKELIENGRHFELVKLRKVGKVQSKVDCGIVMKKRLDVDGDVAKRRQMRFRRDELIQIQYQL